MKFRDDPLGISKAFAIDKSLNFLYLFVLGESKRLYCVIDTMYEYGEYAIPV